MRFKRYYFKSFLERHKIVSYVYAVIIAIIGIVFIIGIFSWDSLLGWIITKERADLYVFVFWAIFAVVVIVVSIVTSIILCRKKNLKN